MPTVTATPPRVLTPDELSALTGFSAGQIRTLARKGRLPGAVDVGEGERVHWRFPESAVYALRPDLKPDEAPAAIC